MAARLNFLEKMAVMFGPIYRYQRAQFPRRWELLKKVAVKELAPPTMKDLPVIKKDFATLLNSIQSQQYKNLTVQEFLVYSAVALEIVFMFFLGEMIGRWNKTGYMVPATYVYKG